MCPGGRPLGRVLSNRCVGRNAPERMIIPTHTGVFTAHVTARMGGAVPHDLSTPRATGGSAMSSGWRFTTNAQSGRQPGYEHPAGQPI